jgi:RNA polymerase sigma factor (sigma-70 family)
VNRQDATDAELVAEVLKGDETAFTALMRRHKSWLYLFIRRHVPTSEDAYDILQEAFASAWAALKSYDRQRPFDVWLRRIALNKCRDRARKEAVRRRVMSFVGLSPEAEVADPAPAADTSQIAGETLGRLNAALEALPRQLKEALILTALQGLPQREAADVLGVTPKVVEMRAYRARKLLAAALDRSDFEDLDQLG